MPPRECSVEAPALVALEAGLVRALLEAPRAQAIGAACAFLLHCAEAADSRPLRRALLAPVSGLGPVRPLIDSFDRVARTSLRPSS